MSQLSAPDAPNTPLASTAGEVPTRQMILEPWTKQQMNIVLLGETGVGKTELVNLIANVCAGATPENFEEKIELSNEAGHNGGSQTIQPHLYSITCVNGHKVNILDTPGLAGDRGIHKDTEQMTAIVHAITENFDAIDAIVILACGHVPRLGLSTHYTMNALSNMLPKSLSDNVAFIFTMVSSTLMLSFDTNWLPQELRTAHTWSIDNPSSLWFKYQKRLTKEPLLEEDLREDMKEISHRGFERATKTLSQFFQYLDKRKVQPTQPVLELYNISVDIETRISNTITRISQAEEKRMRLQKLQVELENQERIKQTNQHYQRIINRPYHELEETGSEYNVLCIAVDCFSNCVERCAFPFTLDPEALAKSSATFEETPGVSPLQWRCKVCGHPAGDHHHYRSKWVKKVATENMIDNESKWRYESAKTELQKIDIIKEMIKKEMAQLEQEITDSMSGVTDTCEKYNKHSLSGNFMPYVFSAIGLLKLREQHEMNMGAGVEEMDRISKGIDYLEKKRKVLEQAVKGVNIHQST
ncbi:hypothetical protein LENED_007002 [Lentinula edodes]|uniref:AIG1-type G domain-containing protein n=1 Tax=Lentinula edodes TaxID=5353 RepID=A0A1Q3EDB5_LENED|nr:hypothetical protein LENED_007002 [Lentinula edodes]